MTRRAYKRPGNPRRADVLPRGMVIGPALNSPWQGDAISGRGTLQKGNFGAGMGDYAFGPTPFGVGARTHWSRHRYSSGTTPGSTPLTIEILWFQVGSPYNNNKEVFQWATESGGAVQTMTINGSGQLSWSWWNGSTRTLNTTTVLAANSLYHIVLTNDRVAGNETTSIYINGALDASVSYSGAMEAITSPVLHVGGRESDNEAYILMASASVACWTPEEVRARYRDPYSHLVWPEDDIFNSVVVEAAALPALTATSALVFAITAATAAAASLAGISSATLAAAVAAANAQASAGAISAATVAAVNGTSAGTAAAGAVSAATQAAIAEASRATAAGAGISALTLADVAGTAAGAIAVAGAGAEAFSLSGLAIAAVAGAAASAVVFSIAGITLALNPYDGLGLPSAWLPQLGGSARLVLPGGGNLLRAPSRPSTLTPGAGNVLRGPAEPS